MPVDGLLLGAFLGVTLTRVLSASLHGVTPLDPPTMIGAAALLGAVAALAAAGPTRRAVRVDPARLLRME